MSERSSVRAFARRLVRKPFKGSFFYEWQVGPWVFQARHEGTPVHFAPNGARTIAPPVRVWCDPHWRRA